MELSKAILNTITYFDLFDYPLTMTEVWRFLFLPNGSPVSLNLVAEELEVLCQNHQVLFKRGFYCLSSREAIIETREERHRLSIPKMRIAEREAERLMAIPGVCGVAVSNSLSFRNSRQSGDIDFFVITENNAVWQSRFFAASYAALFDKRPRLGKKADQLCLCFFTTKQALNLESYMLPQHNGVPDVVRIYWQATLKPMAGKQELWSRFFSANQWIKKFLPNIPFATIVHKEQARASPQSWFENAVSKLQMIALPAALKKETGHGDVVTSANTIKLHQNNGRHEIREHFRKRYQSL